MEEDKLSRLSEEIAALKARVEQLEGRLGARAEAAPTPPPTPPPQVARPAPVPPPPRPATPRVRARPDRSGLEAEIGGNWLNKIGAVALVLGIAFFLKYAIDNRWINETGRIIVGIIVGLACVYGGEYFQKKELPKYAQGISGAGIAILYFTIFAAFAFYRLVPQLPAFAFMILVTITAIALSVRHNAIAIAILGIIGGFLTPALIRGGVGGEGDNTVGLFTYIAILDLGILGITKYKDWRALNLLSLAGTSLVFAGWAADYYLPKKLGITMLYLTIFYAIFAAQSFVQNVVAKRPMNAADILMAVGTPILYFATSYSLLMHDYRIYLGIFAVVVAAVYIIFSRQVQIAGYEDRSLRLLYLSVGAAFLIVAIPIQLKQHWITIGWAAEAAVIAGIGFYMNSLRTRYVALGLLVLVVIRLLFWETVTQVTTLFLNQRFGTFLFAIAMIALVAWLYRRYRDVTSPSEAGLPTVLVIGANLLMIWVLSFEVTEMVSRTVENGFREISASAVALSAVWVVYGVIMLAVGVGLRYRPARIMAIALFGIVIAKTFLYDVWILEKVYRVIAFVGLGVVLLVASYIYQTHRDQIRQFMRGEENREGET